MNDDPNSALAARCTSRLDPPAFPVRDRTVSKLGGGSSTIDFLIVNCDGDEACGMSVRIEPYRRLASIREVLPRTRSIPMAHTNIKCTTDHQIIRDWIEKRARQPIGFTG